MCRGAVLERGRACEGLCSPCSELCLSSESVPFPIPCLSLSPPSLGPHTPGPTTTTWAPLADPWALLTCDQDVQGVTGGRPLGGEAVSTKARVPAPEGGSHRAQGEVCPREPTLELPAKVLGRVTCALLGQSESVIADIRATLEGQALSRGHDRALRGQEGGLPRHTWEKTSHGSEGLIPPKSPFTHPDPWVSLSLTLCVCDL